MSIYNQFHLAENDMGSSLEKNKQKTNACQTFNLISPFWKEETNLQLDNGQT